MYLCSALLVFTSWFFQLQSFWKNQTLMIIKFYTGQVGLTWHMKLIASGEGNIAFGETMNMKIQRPGI